MAGLFNKAKTQAATKPSASAKRETVWLVGNTDDTKGVAGAVKELIQLSREAKANEAKQGVFKKVVKDYAEGKYVGDVARLGVSPESPMNVQNTDGDKVTFVCQDRSGQYNVKDDQREALVGLLGADRAGDLLYEETTFGFNRDILALPGVMEAVEGALEKAVKKLTDSGALTEEQAGLLLDVKVKTSFKPGTMDRLAQICGHDTVKIADFMEIAGSSMTRYVKC